jgi:plastocyanin
MKRAHGVGLVVGVALALAGIAVAADAQSTLVGTVGPGPTISLRDTQGNVVSRVTPGQYDLEVDDRSDLHNFHFRGPGGVDVSTEVDAVGKQTFRVTLVDGRYTFVCDPHADQMNGALQVGTGSPPPPSPPPPAPAPPPPASTPKPSAPVGSRLALTVGPGFAISLRTSAGRKVTTLRPGAYTFVVRDRSAAHNARLRGAGATRSTGVGFVGTRTWRVVLRKGTLVVQCDPHRGTMRQAVRVS